MQTKQMFLQKHLTVAKKIKRHAAETLLLFEPSTSLQNLKQLTPLWRMLERHGVTL